MTKAKTNRVTKRTCTASDKEVGARIRAYRVQRRMTQAALANACGVSFQQMQKYEKGINRVTSGRLLLIARALRQPTEALLPPGTGDASYPTDALKFLGDPMSRRLMDAFVLLPRSMQRAACELIVGLAADPVAPLA